MTMNIFARITKVDEAKRLVIGRAAQEVADKVDELFDYEKSKPHFQDWSKSFATVTDGKSLGNIRAMHGKVSAGVVKEIDFNDTDKAIDIVAHINDDQEWRKVLDGNYTGFSIGGSYVGAKTTEKFDGRDVQRYTAKPSEISIVDNPCIPTATFFDVVKADGAVEKVAFKVKPAEGPTISGTEAQIDEFAKLLNDSNMTMADAIALVKAKMNPVAPTVESLLAELTKVLAGEPEELRKRLSAPEVTYTAFREEALKVMTPDEFKAIALEPLDKQVEAVMTKAKMSAANMDRLQAAHDHLASMGASCGADKTVSAEDLAKAAKEKDDKLTQALERIEKLEKQPMPHVVTLRSVRKGTEHESKETDELTKLPYDKLVKRGDGQIDWAASEEKYKAEMGAA